MILKESLKEILLEQRRTAGNLQNRKFVKREELKKVLGFTRLKHAVIISGIRRCGKSVFLSQIMNSYQGSYYYINFEDERLADFELKDFNFLYELCIELFGNAKTFFLDEVQNIRGWEKWVRRMYSAGFKFFITGSNARLLSKELATLLTGRHLQFSIFPFSFREALIFRKVDYGERAYYLTEKRAVIKKHLSKYVKMGGFPEFLKYRKKEILQEYFNNIIDRDIAERYKVGNIRQVKNLARYLLTNTGNLSTYTGLKKVTEIKSVNTVIKYFAYLENTYLLFKVPFFSYSLKKQMLNPFKVYAVDNGLRNAVSFTFSKDAGRLFETAVAVELKIRDCDIYYWKNQVGAEVDFVIMKRRKVNQLIQVCYDIADGKVKKRELSALVKASRELKCANLLTITQDYEASEKVNWRGAKRTIKFIPLWKWLLEKKA